MKAKLTNTNIHHLLIMLLHFTVIYAPEVMSLVSAQWKYHTIATVPPHSVTSQWKHSSPGGVLTLLKLIKAANQGFLPPEMELLNIYQHICSQVYIPHLKPLAFYRKYNAAIFPSSIRTKSVLSVEPQMKYLAPILQVMLFEKCSAY